MSLRDKLKKGLFSTTSTQSYNPKTHKFKSKTTSTEHGYCDFEVQEYNPFLLKQSRNSNQKCNGIKR